MLAEYRSFRFKRKGVRKAQALRHRRHDPPVRLGFAGRRQKGALARDAPLRIGDCAVLLAPGGGGQQHMGAHVHGVVGPHVLGDHEELEPVECVAHGARARQRYRRIGRHDPQRLDLAALDRLEHLHGLAAFPGRHVGRIPEAAHTVDVVGCESHMGGQLIGEPAHLTASHGVGLAGRRERSHAGPSDPPGGEMAIDDGVDLVGALRRLIDALRIAGDGARAGVE